MRFWKIIYLAITSAPLLFLGGCRGSGDNPKTDPAREPIKIGNTMPYSGPASAYGTIGKAMAAYFEKVNAEGGVNGRPIEFITLDDGYSPPKTKEQIRKLVEREKVLLTLGNLGTAANAAVHDYLNRKAVPQLFVSSGATRWNQPQKYPWTMSWQPSYATESRLFGNYILDHHPDAKIGILYQNDDYGKDYVAGLRTALGERADSMIVAQRSYEVTDPTVDAQIIELKASGATLFYNITTPKFAAQAIRKLHEIQWQPVHLLNSVSNYVSAVFEPAGPERAKGIISLAYFKGPATPGIEKDPAYQKWSRWMDTYYPEGDRADRLNVYGYLVAQTIVHVLKRCEHDLSRVNIMKQAASLEDFTLDMLLPGITLNTSPEDYDPIEKMLPVVFNGAYIEVLKEDIATEQAKSK